ncbi:hypothetical protein C0992_003496 [Termitomyces sp. T32_za158]|nr:hypothetical protein C0992_003496 [Termitomyces sp. T32_za158]
MNQLAFGAAPGLGAGDACGRCFAITGTADPFSPSFSGPFNSIVVKVTDLWYALTRCKIKAFTKVNPAQLVEIKSGAGRPKATQVINTESNSISIFARTLAAQEHFSHPVMER